MNFAIEYSKQMEENGYAIENIGHSYGETDQEK